MQRTAPTLIAATLIGSAFAGNASAASIRECGGVLPAGGYRFEYDPPPGAAFAYNVTTRRVGCRRARRFIAHAARIRHAGGVFTTRGFVCRDRYSGELIDTRCKARGGKVIRWRGGS